MAKLLRIGLTGGIAAGKSTVARRWQQAGATVIDADELAHRALEPGTPTWQEVVREFGREFLNADQTVNRSKLGEIVFGDESKRLALNHIVHPAVHQMQADLLAEYERDGRAEFVLVTIPLLYEVGVERDFDCVVTVACSEQTQLARSDRKGIERRTSPRPHPRPVADAEENGSSGFCYLERRHAPNGFGAGRHHLGNHQGELSCQEVEKAPKRNRRPRRRPPSLNRKRPRKIRP